MAIYGNTLSKRPLTEPQEAFKKDVIAGMSSNPKKLSSKYFYNEAGDKLFHLIMQQPEYYLTCAEHEILQTHGEQIFSALRTNEPLRIIEPGAGDGLKTRLIIQHMMLKKQKFIYNPVDISANVLEILCRSLKETFKQVLCEPMVGDYSTMQFDDNDGYTKLMLFLGSNVGNFTYNESLKILSSFSRSLHQGDYFLLGADLVKDPHRILAAYNDANGYTAKFNYNLLERINQELDANFDLRYFFHYPVYNPVLHQAESYLISRRKQTVEIGAAHQFHIDKWEPIHTEISRKFTVEDIHHLSNACGFDVVADFFDMNHYFCCSLWKKN